MINSFSQIVCFDMDQTKYGIAETESCAGCCYAGNCWFDLLSYASKHRSLY